MIRVSGIAMGLLLLGLAPLQADDWPMLNGHPDRNAVSAEKGLPAVFGKDNLRWSADLGDQTFTTPVIAGGRIFVGTNNQKPRDPAITGDKGVLMCFSEKDGKFLWQAVHEKLPGGASVDTPSIGICSTPCVFGDQVFYVSNRDELVCRAVQDGKQEWSLDMRTELGAMQNQAAASSPVVVGDWVFVVTGNSLDGKTHKVEHPKAPSFIAVSRKTGKVVWQDASPGDRIVEGQWSSPSYGVVEGQPQVAFAGGDGWLYSFEPATGKLLWKFNTKAHEKPPKEKDEHTPTQPIAAPVFAGHRVLVTIGIDTDQNDEGCLRAIDARKRGDITQGGELWRFSGKDFGTSISTATVQGDLVFAIELGGFLSCIEVESGKRLWRHDFLSTTWSVPFVADGKVYVRNGDAEILVFAAARELKLLAKNNADGAFKLYHGNVVAANGVLYFAGHEKLYAVSAAK